jgi:hypothetical protein
MDMLLLCLPHKLISMLPLPTMHHLLEPQEVLPRPPPPQGTTMLIMPMPIVMDITVVTIRHNRTLLTIIMANTKTIHEVLQPWLLPLLLITIPLHITAHPTTHTTTIISCPS